MNVTTIPVKRILLPCTWKESNFVENAVSSILIKDIERNCNYNNLPVADLNFQVEINYVRQLFVTNNGISSPYKHAIYEVGKYRLEGLPHHTRLHVLW